MIIASPLRPSRIERETRVRLETIVTTDETLDLGELTPMFAFVGWGARPSQWFMGQWRADDGIRPQSRIAESPPVGLAPIILLPGVHFGFLKVSFDEEAPVLALGRVTVS